MQQVYESIIDQLPEKTKDFYKFHGVQLISMQFPPNPLLIEQLYLKLNEEIFDSSQYFQLMDNQQEQRYELYSKQKLEKEQNVFLIDHYYSFRLKDLREDLYKDDKLLERLNEILKYSDVKMEIANPEKNEGLGSLEEQFEDMEIEDPVLYKIRTETKCLSLINNKIKEIQKVEELLEDNKQLKIIWLNNNPIEQEKLLEVIESRFPWIEMVNSKLTRYAGEFAVKVLACKMNKQKYDDTSNDQILSLDFESRSFFRIPLSSVQTIATLFPNVTIINLLDNPIQDHSLFLIYIQTILLHFKNIKNILVDQHLEQLLYEKINISEITQYSLQQINNFYIKNGLPSEKDIKVREVMRRIWSKANHYRLQHKNTLDFSSIWYVMDQVGCGMLHSNQPVMKLCPFLFNKQNDISQQNVAFTIAWNLSSIVDNQIITRDFLQGITENHFRSARFYTWYDIPKHYFLNKYYQREAKSIENKNAHQLKYQEIKQGVGQNEKIKSIELQQGLKVKVFTDEDSIKDALKNTEWFEITDDIGQAQIVYLVHESINNELEQALKGKYVNQFPYESCITMKDNLAGTLQKVYGNNEIIQKTYDLEVELDAFMGEFFKREEEGRNNLWIIKHPNLARSIDMTVTDNLLLIIKMTENTPRIAQKYIDFPVTLNLKKVDLRFILLVKSINPVQLYLFDRFWIRSANNDYSLDERTLSQYDTHFTVMNYGAGSAMKTIYCDQFINDFQQQYHIQWNQIYNQIEQHLKDLFIAVQINHPQMQDQYARAIYGIDVMIDQTNFTPKILEVTYSPDCIRANKFYPSFWCDIFSCLYLDILNPLIRPIL